MGLRVMKPSRDRRGLSCDHDDGVAVARHRVDTVTATTSCAEHFRQIGPNSLKFENETTPGLV